MTSASTRRLAARVLASFGFGALFAVGLGCSMAVADDVEYGDDHVTITVTIDEFDPCAIDGATCPIGGDGELAMTGASASIGMALGAGVLLAAIGGGAYAITARRRADQPRS